MASTVTLRVSTLATVITSMAAALILYTWYANRRTTKEVAN